MTNKDEEFSSLEQNSTVRKETIKSTMSLWRKRGIHDTNVSQESDELKACVKEFFEDYLNIRECSDSGYMFAPIAVSCCRAMKLEPLGNLLERMRVLSGAKEAHEEK
jgi:hypothetical protein